VRRGRCSESGRATDHIPNTVGVIEVHGACATGATRTTEAFPGTSDDFSTSFVNVRSERRRIPRVVLIVSVIAIGMVSWVGSPVVGAKQTVPYVLFDSNGQALGLTTSFSEESATVRQGAFFLKYNLSRPWHGVIPVLYGSSACTGPAFMYSTEGVAGLDKRYLGFGQNQWYQLDLEAPITTLKERKASDGRIYFWSLTGSGLSCSSQRVFAGAGVLYDEMLAVPLKEIDVEPRPATLRYPLFVEEYDSDEEYELFGDIAVERAANGYWISVTTGSPMQRFTVVARLGGKKQLRWNSRSGSDGFKRITAKQSLSGATVRLLIDGDVVDEVIVQP